MKKIVIASFITLVSVTSLMAPVAQAAEPTLYAEKGFGENVDNLTAVVETKDSPLQRLTSSGVDGGWWRRGKNGSSNISEYQHYSKQGHASCENGNGTFKSGGWKSAYTWSKASVGWTVLGGNRAYYNHR
ncbi:bacteriocin [Enterococcus sp. BWR-S5]|uniref:bacteriocin n=1 Tax=Enterococcus sp. BWR-S5 TaxID=2787714 RepID=UPI001923CB03|nr:bacteriocin [Enterococcus sp. BWR-S5]MBL1223639.1 bacteriocin [Enterococcus sp. BWR-S5]